jgi:hypothetical protein
MIEVEAKLRKSALHFRYACDKRVLVEELRLRPLVWPAPQPRHL